MKVSDLEKARHERLPDCPFCGQKSHQGEYACPRIQSVTHSPETGEITVRFYSGFHDVPSG